MGETALLTHLPRNASVEALTTLSVILMHHAEFAQMMRIPSVAAKVWSVQAARTCMRPTAQPVAALTRAAVWPQPA